MKIPTWLNKDGKATFKEVVTEMENLGIYREADAGAVAIYADAVAKFREVTKVLQKDGYVYKDKNGVERRHMLIPLENTLASRIKDYALVLGITPYGRKKVDAQVEMEEAEEVKENNIYSIAGMG